jgi:hypothetical protein
MITLNQTVFDQQSQTNVVLNDLSLGEYDVVCEMGPAFNSAQKESARSFEVMAAIDPSFAQSGMDIWLKNKKEPGMDLMAERFRVQLFQAGMIPESQWTDEEKQQVQQQQKAAQNQPPVEDPNMIIAQAEMGKAQAEQQNAQNKQVEIQGNQQVKMAEIQLKNKVIDLDTQKFIKGQDDKFNVDAAKIQQGQQKLDMEASKQEFNAMMQTMQLKNQEMNDSINNLKVLREAMGVDSIVGPTNTQAYKDQADAVLDEQKGLE